MKFLRSKLPESDIIELNKSYATVENDGHFYVVRLEDFTIYKPEEFKKALAHMRRTISGSTVKFADEWLIDPRRLHFPHGFIFDPTILPETDWKKLKKRSTLNLWSGFAIKPQKGDVKPYLDFVREIVCTGDEHSYKWVMAWLANIIQKPADKPGTALVLRGEQGIGKSFFVSCIGKILGERTFWEISEPELLVGRFSGHFKGKLLFCADEGSFATKKAAARLKNLITAEKQAIEEKHRNPIYVDNHMRIIITGNDPKIIEASRDERRYCVLNVSPVQKQNKPYWGKLWAWQRNGGLAALHHYLKNLKIDGVDLRTVPQTQALMDQKLSSLDEVEQWIFGILRRGYVREGLRWATPIATGTARASYAEFHGLKTDMSKHDSWIGIKLHEIFPNMKKGRPRLNSGQQEYHYTLPPLDDCRRAFEAHLGGIIDWSELEKDN